ncbi:helix-turn-helix domain-containing protein [Kitasatospora sp. NPDC059160]|uniref:helix-turn-helix domain-containing protein n=1 Tax=Kitasatospora sp. NPDC059160 TaxID=3346748 RepID=UPI0036803457
MASVWKDLPEELSEPARLLAEELRKLKDDAGLSLSELATRTHYSRASWERWLNGKRVVTEQALEALIRAVDCDPVVLRRLRQRAAVPVVPGTVAQEAVAREAVAPKTEDPGGEPGDRSAEPAPTDDGSVPGTDPSEPAAEPAETAEPSDDPTAGPVAGAADGPAAETTDECADEPAVAWWRRPAALVAGAAVLALLLVLAGLHLSRHDDQASAADGPAPSTSATGRTAPTTAAVAGAPDCRALGCAHKDPKTTGCGRDARTLQTQVIGKVVVYLRYSQTCQAAWAAISEGEPKDFAVITDTTGDSETAMIHWGYDNYSPMLNAADPSIGFQVCGTQPAGHDCTGTVTDLARVVASTPIPIGPASPPPGAGATPSDSASAPASADPAQGATQAPSAEQVSPSPAASPPGQSR